MKTFAFIMLCYVAVILGWKRLWDAVAPRREDRRDVRHPSEVWDGIEDVDSLDGGS